MKSDACSFKLSIPFPNPSMNRSSTLDKLCNNRFHFLSTSVNKPSAFLARAPGISRSEGSNTSFFGAASKSSGINSPVPNQPGSDVILSTGFSSIVLVGGGIVPDSIISNSSCGWSWNP